MTQQDWHVCHDCVRQFNTVDDTHLYTLVLDFQPPLQNHMLLGSSKMSNAIVSRCILFTLFKAKEHLVF